MSSLRDNLRALIDEAPHDLELRAHPLTAPAAAPLRAVAKNVIAVSVAMSALLFVWRPRFLPLQDFPDWVTQGKLFADVLRGQLANVYSFKSVPIPNTIASVCIGLLSLVLNPEVAGKWVLSGYVVGFSAAVSYLLEARAGRTDPLVFVVSLIFLLNFSFFHGEINYALALVFLYGGFGFVRRFGASLNASDTLGIALLSLVIFFCHGAGYAVWLVFLTAYVWETRSVRSCIRVAIALAPSLTAAIVYAASRHLEGAVLASHWTLNDLLHTAGAKLWLLVKFLSPLQCMYPFLSARSAWLFVVGNVMFIAMVATMIVRGAKLRGDHLDFNEKLVRTTLAILALAFVVAPCQIGGLVNPAERLILPALQLVMLSMAPLDSPHAFVRSIRAWVLLVIQAAYLQFYAGSVSDQLALTYARLYGYATTSTLSIVHESHFDFQGRAHPARPLFWRLLPLHYPLQRLTYFASLEVGHTVPIFETGMFQSSLPYVKNNTESLQQLPTRMPILIVGWGPGNEAVASLLKGATRLDSDDRTFTLLQRE